jgi:hypothetical protein
MDRDTSGGTAGGELFGDAESGRSKAAEAGEQAADKAREVGHQVEEVAMSKAEEGRHRVADEVHRVGEALRTGARQMRDGKGDRTTDFIERLAEPVERVSRYLEQHDTRELASDLEDFARRNQAVFLGGAFALGMMGAPLPQGVVRLARERWPRRNRLRPRLRLRPAAGAGADPARHRLRHSAIAEAVERTHLTAEEAWPDSNRTRRSSGSAPGSSRDGLAWER